MSTPRHAPRNLRLFALILVPLCIALASCAVTVSSTSTPTSAANASATTKATAAATKAVSPTATTIIGKPVLGGPGAAFIAQYGPLTNQSDPSTGDLHFRQYPGVALDFLIVDLGVHYGFTPGDQDAASILVAPAPGQSWSPIVAHNACTAFSPSDAQLVNNVQVSLQGAIIGQDTIYRSATLAAAFPASTFVDANQNPTQPGTFDVMYLYVKDNDSSMIDSCELLVGSQQTQ